jgi:peroxiredoxin
MAARGYTGVRALVVNAADKADSVAQLGGCRFPVLQDTAAAGVWALYAANKDAVFVIDANGFVRNVWNDPDAVLQFDVDAAGLEQAIAAASE